MSEYADELQAEVRRDAAKARAQQTENARKAKGEGWVQPPCSLAGCVKPSRTRGMCSTHYRTARKATR